MAEWVAKDIFFKGKDISRASFYVIGTTFAQAAQMNVSLNKFHI